MALTTRTRWGVSLAATVASAYALDAVATGAGLLLSTSSLLDSFGQPALLVLLGGSYAVWALGLRTNLPANWELLERTGTSSNVVSKAAYDLAVRSASSRWARRVAASCGYVGAELAKEVPYYAGAFGAALSATVTSEDALIFLIGTNVAAGGYEYLLARLTRALLHRR